MRKPLYPHGKEREEFYRSRNRRNAFVVDNLLTDAMFVRLHQYDEAQRGLMPFERRRAGYQIAKEYGFENVSELEWYTILNPRAPKEWGGF